MSPAPRLPRWCLVPCLLLLAALARAQPHEELSRAALELRVNGQSHSSVVVVFAGRDALVPLAALRDAGLINIQSRSTWYDGIEYVSLRRSIPRLGYRIDEIEAALELQAPPQAFGKAEFDLASAAPAGVWYSSEPSVLLSYAPRLANGRRFEGFGDSVLSLGPGRLANSASHDPERGVVRLLSRVELDQRSAYQRWTLGDSSVVTSSLGGAPLLGGLTLMRQYELDPYLVRVPRLGYSGNALSPSIVDVYVNDTLVRRVPVGAGQFRLSNLTTFNGAGNVRYVVRDAFGAEQSVDARYYATSAVLASGLSEYSYAVGFERLGFGNESFHYGAPLALARYRRGLNDALTLGGRVELTPKLGSGGLELALAGGFGELETSFGASVDAREERLTGSAFLFGYAYQGRRSSLRSALKTTSRYYANSTLAAEDWRNLIEWSNFTSTMLSQRTSIASGITFGVDRDLGPNSRFNLQWNLQLTPELAIGINASHARFSNAPNDSELFVMLSSLLPWRHVASLSERYDGKDHDLTATLSRSMSDTTGIGYQASASLGSIERAALSAQGQASFARASVSLTHSNGATETLIDGATSLAFLPGSGLYLSRPVHSFAVIEVPGLPGVRGYLNNREIGTTDDEGELFVPDLLPYYGNQLSIEPADLPLDQELDGDAVELAPPPGGGARVVFGVKRVALVRGQLVLTDNEHTPLKYGLVVATLGRTRAVSPLGVNGEFEFDGLGPGTYTLEADSGAIPCHALLTVPIELQPIHEAGTVSCHTGPLPRERR